MHARSGQLQGIFGFLKPLIHVWILVWSWSVDKNDPVYGGERLVRKWWSVFFISKVAAYAGCFVPECDHVAIVLNADRHLRAAFVGGLRKVIILPQGYREVILQFNLTCGCILGNTGPKIITYHGLRETGWKKFAFTCLLWVNKPQINYPISRNP